MARIRSIKPDFWTDEKVVELSPFARLLFIGLWNFADDEGRMVYSPKKIKMQIFPADDLSISELFGELRRESLICVYVIDGTEYLQVTNFSEHQKIDKRNASKLPPPTSNPELPRISTTDKEGNGREGIKTDEPTGPATPSVQASPENNHKAIIFNLGVSLLTKNGELDQTARSFLGKLAKGGEAKLAEAIGYLAANPKIDPKAYLSAAMKPKERGLVL